eukprot:gene17701-24059_t
MHQIAAGSVSAVYKGTCKSSGIDVAIKVYKKKRIKIHSQLSHKNIIKMYAAFEDCNFIYIVMEFAEMGDLSAVLQTHGGVMTETAAVDQIIHPSLSALEYLHDLGLVHRNIEPENLFLTAAGVLKVAVLCGRPPFTLVVLCGRSPFTPSSLL